MIRGKDSAGNWREIQAKAHEGKVVLSGTGFDVILERFDAQDLIGDLAIAIKDARHHEMMDKDAKGDE